KRSTRSTGSLFTTHSSDGCTIALSTASVFDGAGPSELRSLGPACWAVVTAGGDAPAQVVPTASFRVRVPRTAVDHSSLPKPSRSPSETRTCQAALRGVAPL